MRDVIIVGGGIIGATIARTLGCAGRDVLCLDRHEPYAGTAPSGGHLKPSWLGMKEEEYKPGMDVLDAAWGLVKQDFRYKGELTTVFRVDTDLVVSWPGKIRANVTSIKNVRQYPSVTYVQQSNLVTTEHTRLLIVAAGIWSADMLSAHGYHVKLEAKQGVSFRVKHTLAEPFIKEWAPYKQIVAHQQGEQEVWIGDGTTILQKNWRDQRDDECLDRCLTALSLKQAPYRKLHGFRPTISEKSGICLMDNPFPRVWVVTGASKRGTIAAGCAAFKFLSMGDS